jgi:prophage DNA circulation protein
VRYDFGFAVGRIDRQAKLALNAAKLNRTLRALVEQTDQLLVNVINLFSPMLDAHPDLRSIE